jgi:hypothetical protein
MAIRATCEDCFLEYTVADDKAGRTFKCKECGGAVRVPRSPAASTAPRAAAAPPPQRRSAGAGKSASKTKKPRSSSGAAAGALLPLLLGGLVLIGVGVGVYVLLPFGGGAGGAGDDGATESAAAAEALSTDEQALLADFHKMVASQPGQSSPEQRKAAFEAFAAEHNVTTDEMLALAQKAQAVHAAANRVDAKWQPLDVTPPATPAWPARVRVNIPKGFGEPWLKVTTVRTPFALASATAQGGSMRHVINLATSQSVGSWLNATGYNLNEQVSPDGKLVLLQEGTKAPVSLQVVDAAGGKTLQTISSPDILLARVVAFVTPQQIVVFSPAGQSREQGIRVLLFDATTGQEVARHERAYEFAGDDQVSFSPDGRYLAAKGKGKSIEVCEIDSGKQVGAVDLAGAGMEHGTVYAVAFAPDGKKIAVLEQKPLTNLCVHIVDCATGEVTRGGDLDGGTTSLGGIRELQLDEPLAWFPDSRHVLICKLAAIDTTTGRRVWQARGDQSGPNQMRIPSTGGVLYQVNGEQGATLETAPIDFARIASTQQSWPTDAALAPGMSVSVAVDLSAGGLQSLNDIVATAVRSKLEQQGFAVSEGADRVLSIGVKDGSVAFAWTGADGQPLWEWTATDDSALLSLLGHLKDYTPERALAAEGIAKLLSKPIPWFIAADGWTLPAISQINHGGL